MVPALPAREDVLTMRQPDELLVIVFAGETRAGEVLQVVQRLHEQHIVDLHNTAIVVRNAKGQIAIHETNDFTPGQGVVAGGLVGGLVGMLTGNLARDALLGAGAGYVASRVLDLGFSDDFLRQIGEAMIPGSSALVLAIEFERVDEAIRALEPYRGKILRQTLPPDVAQKLAAAMEGAQP
jgi:uncharacterized membrane protein